MTKREYSDYRNFVQSLGVGCKENGVDITHSGHPLSVKESKFIDLYMVYGDINKALAESGCTIRQVAYKDYIIEEIQYRLNELKKKTIADADEIMQYFTSVMRGETKDQFGLDAPLCERTSAAKELARRVIDLVQDDDPASREIHVKLHWD